MQYHCQRGDIIIPDPCAVDFDSPYFTLIELSAGVYAAVEKGRTAGSNAGLIDLGGRTVVFDAFLDIDAARDLRRAGEELTDRPAWAVVNSHGHADHIVGDCLFEGNAAIISSDAARSEIEEDARGFMQEKSGYRARIEEIEREMAAADGNELADLCNELFFAANLAKDCVTIATPDLSFTGEMALHGSGRSLLLRSYPAAHSKGDVIALLPGDGVCFTGDLLFADRHPWLGSGDPEALMSILEDLSGYDAAYFVPGHGRLATKADLSLQARYIRELLRLVREKGSADAGDYSPEDLPPVYRGWGGVCFPWNIEFLLKRGLES